MEGEECILCYEALDIPVFERNTTNDVIVGATSSRLQCGHAYHTSCLLRSLQHRSVCPLCNVLGQHAENDPDWWNNGRIALEGRCIEIMTKIKKDKEVAASIREFRARMKELRSIKTDFNKRLKAFKTALRAEMGIDEKMKGLRFKWSSKQFSKLC